jgi:hypothetical protein
LQEGNTWTDSKYSSGKKVVPPLQRRILSIDPENKSLNEEFKYD